MRRRSVCLVVASIVLAACTSSDDSTREPPPSAAGEPARTEPVATEPAATEPASTDPPDTDPPVDTDPPATGPPATDPPPTEPAATDAEVIADSAVTALPVAYEGYVSEVYGDDAVWMCRGGVLADDLCLSDLDATAVLADGTTEARPHDVATDPAVDCFYVYPTTSQDQSSNSDFDPGEADELSTTLNQAARLTGACRVFAPVYRQVTLPALLGQVETTPDAREIAYADVVDAFRHFIANDSDGRPFVLTGHSQGAGILRAMIAEEIDDEPLLRDRLVSAILLGTGVAPDEYGSIPACESVDQIACVVSYAAFRDTVPPGEGALFGRAGDGPAICVNPVDPSGGALVSQPYFTTQSTGLLGGAVSTFDEGVEAPEITTPFVTYPDMVTLQCADDGTFGYLELSITTADGPRTDDIGGDLTPEWGMHLVDANVAMGDLVDLVRAQSASVG